MSYEALDLADEEQTGFHVPCFLSNFSVDEILRVAPTEKLSDVVLFSSAFELICSNINLMRCRRMGDHLVWAKAFASRRRKCPPETKACWGLFFISFFGECAGDVGDTAVPCRKEHELCLIMLDLFFARLQDFFDQQLLFGLTCGIGK